MRSASLTEPVSPNPDATWRLSVMQNSDGRISRRTALKGAAVSGFGVVVGGTIAGKSPPQGGVTPEALMRSNDE